MIVLRGCHQPVEALAHRQAADRAEGGAAGAEPRDRRQVVAHDVEVDGRVEGEQAALVELDGGAEEVAARGRRG